MEQPTFEVISMGRVGIDFYPLDSGVGLEDASTFGKFLGGSATNVAVAAARHGHRVAVITRTGEDPFGRFVHNQLNQLGVDDRYVAAVAGMQTPVAFCERFPPDHFPLYFYRRPKAPDQELTPADIDVEAVRSAEVFWMTAAGLAAEPSRSAHRAALAARARARHTVLDLDLRPGFWRDMDEAVRETQAVLPQVTIAIGNQKECEVAVGETDPVAAARALLDAGVDLAIVKRGPDGVVAITADEEVSVPALSIEICNGLGAGDGFGGALCHGLIEGWPLQRTIEFANAAGAIVASRLECAAAMPTTDEVELMMGGSHE